MVRRKAVTRWLTGCKRFLTGKSARFAQTATSKFFASRWSWTFPEVLPLTCCLHFSPFNWYQCGNEGINGKKRSGNSTEAFNEGVAACLTEETKIFAETNIQPLQLKCKDASQCRTDGDFVYFVRNTTDWGDRMTVMCLWEYSAEQHLSREICLKPMLELAIARTLG